MAKLVYGIGINDRSCPAKTAGGGTREYTSWMKMLERCYAELAFFKNPTYVGCSVSKNFKNYSFFYQWCQNQIGFDREGFELDKDLLIKGNKLYSEDNCVFIPRCLNTLLVNCKQVRGEFPIGVTWNNSRYLAQLSAFGKLQYLGTFPTPQEAFQAYKQAKEAHIKDMAQLYKANIDPRAYAALMSYQVEITD